MANQPPSFSTSTKIGTRFWKDVLLNTVFSDIKIKGGGTINTLLYHQTITSKNRGALAKTGILFIAGYPHGTRPSITFPLRSHQSVGIWRSFDGAFLSWPCMRNVTWLCPRDNLFSHITVADIHRDLIRNIVHFNESEDPFDYLTSSTEE